MLQLPAEVLQSLHDYLLTRPMREVENLVFAVRQATPVAPPVAPPVAEPTAQAVAATDTAAAGRAKI